MSFYLNYQNASVCFFFLGQVTVIVFLNLSGIDKFKQESKNKLILLVVAACRHREMETEKKSPFSNGNRCVDGAYAPC